MLLYFFPPIVLVHLAFIATLITCSDVKKIDLTKLVCLVNYERTVNKVPAVGMDKKLDDAAQVQSIYQADTEQMSHTGPKGSNVGKRVDDAKYQWLSVAENVAFGFNTEEDVVHKWMCSPKHKANTLDTKHKMMGGSACTSKKGVVYWTLVLASDAKKDPENVPNCDKYKAAIEYLKKLDAAGCDAKPGAGDNKPKAPKDAGYGAKKEDLNLTVVKPDAKKGDKDVNLTVVKPGAKTPGAKKEDLNLTVVKPGAKKGDNKDVNLTVVKPGAATPGGKKEDLNLTVAKPGAKKDDVNLTVVKPGAKAGDKKDLYVTATKPGEKKPNDINLTIAKPPTPAKAIDLSSKVYLRCVCDPQKAKKGKKKSKKKQVLKCLCTPDDELAKSADKKDDQAVAKKGKKDKKKKKKKDLKKKKKKKKKDKKKKKKDAEKKKKKDKKKKKRKSTPKTKPKKDKKKKKKKEEGSDADEKPKRKKKLKALSTESERR